MEVETTKMSTRGQVIIPKEVREYIHAGEGTLFTVVTLDEETFVMKRIDKAKLLQEFQDIKQRVKKKLTQQEITDEIKETRKNN